MITMEKRVISISVGGSISMCIITITIISGFSPSITITVQVILLLVRVLRFDCL